MGQSLWDDIKILGHGGVSICLSICLSKWDDINILGCPMLAKMRVHANYGKLPRIIHGKETQKSFFSTGK